MNLKLVIGTIIFVIGLITAVVGIVGVGQPEREGPPVVLNEDRSLSLPEDAAAVALPWIAGLTLAVGGLLIGLSVGNFKNPRTYYRPGDEIVNPEGHHTMKHV